MAGAGIVQSQLAAHMVDALMNLIDPVMGVRRTSAVQIIHFRLVQVNVHAAQGVHNVLEAGEVHFHVVVNAHAEVLGNGLVQQVKAAQLVGRVQLSPAVAGDLHVQVTHQRDHRHLIAVFVDTENNHGVGAFPGTGSAVLTHQQNVHHAVHVGADLGIAPFNALGFFHLSRCGGVHKLRGQQPIDRSQLDLNKQVQATRNQD